jgi:hypothetical protein
VSCLYHVPNNDVYDGGGSDGDADGDIRGADGDGASLFESIWFKSELVMQRGAVTSPIFNGISSKFGCLALPVLEAPTFVVRFRSPLPTIRVDVSVFVCFERWINFNL